MSLTCNKCGSTDGKLRRCTGCMQVWYCSKQCQIEHWQLTHKIDCKLRQMDQILFDLAKDEKTGFMELGFLDNKLSELSQISMYRLPGLPNLMVFINPLRYLCNIVKVDKSIRQQMCKQQTNMKFDSTPFKNLDLTIKKTSKCGEVFGMMKYLAMCGKINDYMSFHNAVESGRDSVKKVIYNFMNKNNGTFSMLFVFLGFSQYDLEGARVHYFCVIKLHERYRLVQSFGKKFSLEQDLQRREWMNQQEIGNILNAFIALEMVGIVETLTSTQNDVENIKQKSKLCLGFELLMCSGSKKIKHNEMTAVIMKNLVLKDFMSGARHLLDYLAFMFDKFEKREFASIANQTALRYRIGFPMCLQDEYLKKINDENGWGYKIR